MCNEKFKELFSKDIYQLPIRWDGNDFYLTLYKHLKTYSEDIKENFNDRKKLYSDVERIFIKICAAVNYSFRGYPEQSYKIFKEVMKILDKEPLLVETSVLEKEKMYRVVDNGNATLPKRKRVFHVPFSMRSKMSTKRYSIPGYPSLYLGTSIELCCMELGKMPTEDYLCASRFEIEKIKRYNEPLFFIEQRPKYDNGKILVYDLSLKPEEITNSYFSEKEVNKYLKWYPLILSCSYIRAMRDDPYSPEYIIPQLFIQWLRTQNENSLVGIKYFSCVSCYASSLGRNYVFPSTGIPYHIGNDTMDYCPRLSHRFKLTNPKFIKEYENLKLLENKLDDDNLPDFIEGYDESENRSIKGSYSIMKGVYDIGDYAFCDCDLMTDVSIPISVTNIGDNAFDGCEKLKEIKIPSSVNYIGNRVFIGCKGLVNVNVEKLNKVYVDIEGILYKNSKKRKSLICFPAGKSEKIFKIPIGTVVIHDYAFYECKNLNEIEMPKSVECIGDFAFHRCENLSKIILSKNLKNISVSAFNHCVNLKKVILPDSIKSIEEFAFFRCKKLEEINIPNSTINIKNYVFAECGTLREIKIPNSVKKIGSNVFMGCINLLNIFVDSSNNKYIDVEGILYNKHKTELICYPSGRMDTSFKIPIETEGISSCAFYGCKNLTEIKIPNSITHIGEKAFLGCRNIIEVKFPESVEELGSGIFIECDNLMNILVEDSNKKYIDIDGVLYSKDKTRLICYPPGKKEKEFKIPYGVQYIEWSAFNSCYFLESIIIPDSVIEVEVMAFTLCTNLSNVRVNSNIKLSSKVFYGCSEDLEIHNSKQKG